MLINSHISNYNDPDMMPNDDNVYIILYIVGFISAFEICHPINCHNYDKDIHNNNNNDDDDRHDVDENDETVVSQINSLHDKPSSTQSATIIAPLHYVTHKNHRDQEVGVDHIFIRPMMMMMSNNNYRISSDEDTVTTPNDTSEKKKINYNNHENSLLTSTATATIATTTTSTTATTTITTTTADTSLLTTTTTSIDDDNNDNTVVAAATSLNNSHNLQSNLSVKASTSSISSTIDHDSSSSSSSSTSSSYRIFVNTSQVLPTHLSCHYWKDDFHISDHRPIKTNIIIIKND